MKSRDLEKDLELLASAFFENLQINNCEYGGIGLDDKCPFGDSDVNQTIMEILKMEPEVDCPNCGQIFLKTQSDYAEMLYREKLIPYLQLQWHKPVEVK